MKSSKSKPPAYTDAPWHVEVDPGGCLFVTNRDRQHVARLCVSEQEEANACLIAAAPNLLASIKELLDSLNALGRIENKQVQDACDRAYAALEAAS